MAKKKNALRQDGRIAVQVYLGIEDGQRRYKTVYGRTQKEADEKALQLKLALHKGLDLTATRDSFGEWAEHFARVKAGEVSAGRVVVYQSHIKHLNRYLQYAPITKIRTADLQSLVADLAERNPNTGRPMARDTLKGLKSTAVQIFQLAIDNRVLDYNPALSLRIPAGTAPNPRRALTEEEQQWIIDTPHRAQRAALIMMYAGLRRGELIPLTWNDVDLRENTIRVSKSVEFVGGLPEIKDGAKTAAGTRLVMIPQRLADFLAGEPRESVYVCINAQGSIHTESSWRRMWQSYLADLNIKYGDFTLYGKQYKSKFDHGVPFVIPKITPHWLRHTFATMLYMADVDVLTARDQLGHSDIKTTLEIYTHLDALYKRKSMNKLNEYIQKNQHASQMQVKK